jgi:hypothetical protein
LQHLRCDALLSRSHEKVMKSIELIGRHVIPALKQA